MKKINRHISLENIAGIILAVFVFTFMHSEFGFLTPDNHTHHTHQTHDFCQLVNGITNQIQKSVNTTLYKPTVIKDICFHCFDETPSVNEKVLSKIFEDDLIKGSYAGDIQIQNCTFLI